MQANAQPLVCYCFGYTAAEITAEAQACGRSAIMTRIAAAKKSGGCQCEVKHPRRR